MSTLFASLTVLNFVLGTIIANVESKIGEGLIIFAVLSLISICVDYVVSCVSADFSTKVSLDFNTQMLEKYSKMTKLSKSKTVMSIFEEKLNKANWAIKSKYTWGTSVLASVMSSVINFCVIAWTHKQYKILVIFVCVHTLWYFLITKNMMLVLDKNRQEVRQKRGIYYSIIYLLMTRLHNGQCKVNEIMEKKKELEYVNANIDKYWSYLSCTQRIPNFIIILIVGTLVEKNLYVVLYIICNNVTSSVNNAMTFMNQYKTMQNDIEELNNFWEDKDFGKDYEQKEIPQILSFYGTVYNDNKLIFSINSTKSLSIKQGEKIQISGVSGAGKTTLLKAILGHVEGGFYDSNDHPLSYDDSVEYMCQDARSTIPTIKTNIRQIFYDEDDKEKIVNSLKIVGLTKWFEKTMTSDIDAPINENLSGGEKTRLCLAVSLYRARKRNVTWLILDEPDAGIDTELCPILLRDIINEFRDTTIFLIVHLCECQLSKVGIKKEWKVDNGKITEILH